MVQRTIEVRCDPASEPTGFHVIVRDGNGETRHQVTVSSAFRIQGGISPEAVVEAAFRFLLDREAKESILARFDISVISRYFPEFERELPRYLATAGGTGES